MRIARKFIGLLAIASMLLLSACAVGAVQAAPAEADPPAPAASAYNGGEQKPTERSITVQGQGTVSARPDLVTLSLGVQTTGATAMEAISLNSEQMSGVVAAIQGYGIADEDVQTSGINLYPVYEDRSLVQQGEQRQIVGYRATNSVIVTVHDIPIAGSLLDAAIIAGANQVSGLQFGLSDTEAIVTDALIAAVENARAKAQTIADTLGVKLGAALVVNEEYIERPRANVYLERAEAAFDSGSISAPVQGGSVSVTAHIRVTFAIE